MKADGAKRLPFKFPKQKEPVYISSSNKVVYIVGMSALNQPLKSLCRAELLAKFLQKQVNENLTKKWYNKSDIKWTRGKKRYR
mgnify:CR=1 FL=1